MTKVSRRGFLGTMAAAATAARGFFTGGILADAIAAQGENGPSTLPWNREVLLREAARSTVMEGVLSVTGPVGLVLRAEGVRAAGVASPSPTPTLSRRCGALPTASRSASISRISTIAA